MLAIIVGVVGICINYFSASLNIKAWVLVFLYIAINFAYSLDCSTSYAHLYEIQLNIECESDGDPVNVLLNDKILMSIVILYIINNIFIFKFINALSKVTIDGIYFEFGFFSGRTINHIKDKALDKIIYGFDSFEGVRED
uniref:hypothetical protein n=1 Tax=Clostridium butyricum TaxID=1492 RepID=UPI001FB11BB5|nr:hypothetical protein [Clostridium butyricum]